MAAKRDLVEAHQFSRRRLITAFVSGAPGGREVEPARSGRARWTGFPPWINLKLRQGRRGARRCGNGILATADDPWKTDAADAS